jgi:hypothetical protein
MYYYCYKYLPNFVVVDGMFIIQVTICGSFFKCVPLWWKCKMCIILSVGPKLWELSSKCWAKLEEMLLILKDKWCSLNLCEKLLPIWPVYTLLQFGQECLDCAR